MSLVLHLYELLACFDLISSVSVYRFASFPIGLWYLSRIWIWIGPFPVWDMDWPLWRTP